MFLSLKKISFDKSLIYSRFLTYICFVPSRSIGFNLANGIPHLTIAYEKIFLGVVIDVPNSQKNFPLSRSRYTAKSWMSLLIIIY
jgi:hypothetical protein